MGPGMAIAAALLSTIPGVDRGLAVGERAFGPALCGTPTVAIASFQGAATVSGADPRSCEILLNEEYVRAMPAEMACTLVAHEYGHLAGRGHSDNPRSLMYHLYVRPDRRCLSRARARRGTSDTGPPRA